MACASYQKKYRKLVKEVSSWLQNTDDLEVVGETDADNTAGTAHHQDAGDCEIHDTVDCTYHAAEVDMASDYAVTIDDDSMPISSDEDNASTYDLHHTESLKNDLAAWVVDSHLTREACNGLLAVLRKHGCQLPKDRRTLLRTPDSVDVQLKCGGQYVYFGIRKCLHAIACTHAHNDVLQVQVNIDGVPLYKSSGAQFWPILCSVNNSQPAIIALFFGKAKPTSLEEFLYDFVQEFNELQLSGFTCEYCDGGVNIPVSLHSIICDAPARAFVKNIKGHTSTNGCERCTAVGSSVSNRIVFTAASCFSAEKRTGEQFSNHAFSGSHQNGPTPLSLICSDCVNICALDYMHLICLGTVRRMMQYWRSGDRLVRISSRQVLEISEKLITLKQYIPTEFARRPRSLLEMDRWKATEYRQFLLYSGPVVLKHVLPQELYKHFLCLSVSVSILLSESRVKCTDMRQYAEKLLHYFVVNCEHLYGKTFVVYNIHSLLHVADDVKHFGTNLDNISAFRYENYLQTLKRLLRGTSNPLVQVSKRLQEYETVNCKPFAVKSQQLHMKLSCSGRDSIVFLKTGQFAEIVEKNDDKLLCRVYHHHSLHPFFTEPCSSELIDVYFVNKRAKYVPLKQISSDDIERKGIRLPCGDGHVLLPLLHRENAESC